MAAPLGAVLARVADRFNAVEIVNVPEVERILRKNGFLTQYRYQPIEDENSSAIPYRRLQRTDEGVFEDYLQQHLKGKGIPRMSEGMGKVFKKKIFEVFQNSVIHSRIGPVHLRLRTILSAEAETRSHDCGRRNRDSD